MKISGADFVAWQNSDWGSKDAHCNYTLLIKNVVVDPEDKIEIHEGVVYLGKGKEISVSKHFKRWKEAQTHETVVFSVPKETVPEFITAAEGFGAKVIK